MRILAPDGRGTDTATRRAVVALAGVGIGTGLAGCSSGDGDSTPTANEATVTVRIRNRDGVQREYRVAVRQGGDVTNEFSGTLPADQEQFVEMVATFRPTDERHEVSVGTDGGQQGRTWDPTECRDFLVDAYVEDGTPGFDAECRNP